MSAMGCGTRRQKIGSGHVEGRDMKVQSTLSRLIEAVDGTAWRPSTQHLSYMIMQRPRLIDQSFRPHLYFGSVFRLEMASMITVFFLLELSLPVRAVRSCPKLPTDVEASFPGKGWRVCSAVHPMLTQCQMCSEQR